MAQSLADFILDFMFSAKEHHKTITFKEKFLSMPHQFGFNMTKNIVGLIMSSFQDSILFYFTQASASCSVPGHR